MTKILLDATHSDETNSVQVTVLLDEDGKEVLGAIEIFDGGTKITCDVQDDDLARLRVVNKADLIASVLNALLLHTNDETEIPLVPACVVTIEL